MNLDEASGLSDDWGFDLAMPEVFVRLDLDLEGAELRAAAARLVDARAAVDPLIAVRRKEWVRHVVTFGKDARAKQALAAWTMVHDTEGLPVRAFLLVHEGEREHPDDVEAEIGSLESALSVMREGDVGERQVSVVQLQAGPAVRVRVVAEIEPWKRRSPVLDGVEYWVPVPGEPVCFVLSFTTPVLLLADILADIADEIAQSLRFVP